MDAPADDAPADGARADDARARGSSGEPGIPAPYLALIGSDRVSLATREALLGRARCVEHAAAVLTDAERAVLRAAVARIIPQPEGGVDLAGRIEAALASGEGDGWRFAALPCDLDACRGGLAALEAAAAASGGGGFAALDGEGQDALLRAAGDGALDAGAGLDAARLRLWFEDLRAAAVRIYVAHPATLGRIGYGGIAYGGDVHAQGFRELEPGAREDWETQAAIGPAA